MMAHTLLSCTANISFSAC